VIRKTAAEFSAAFFYETRWRGTVMRIALGVEYDGRGFCGWQTQPDGGGIQDRLEAALSQIADHSVSTICAGRTDAGVHASGQVVHFDSTVERPLTSWTRGVNALLPDAVAVTWARPVDDSFHARFSATAREYRYVLLNDRVRPALESGRVGWCHAPLDINAMQAAAACLLGTHDFSAFRSAECQARSPVRTLERLQIVRSGMYVLFDFRANAFLHHMVRNIVGSLVHVGKGSQPPSWMKNVLDSRDRTQADRTFEAAGLYLTRVEYPEFSLPAGRMMGRDGFPAG
jgi:tRNA pseudouridine38-40 synthase